MKVVVLPPEGDLDHVVNPIEGESRIEFEQSPDERITVIEGNANAHVDAGVGEEEFVGHGSIVAWRASRRG